MLALMHRPVEAGVALQRVTMKVSVTIINDPVINRLSQGAATECRHMAASETSPVFASGLLLELMRRC